MKHIILNVSQKPVCSRPLPALVAKLVLNLGQSVSHWPTGPLAHWPTGPLAHRPTGPLAHWPCIMKFSFEFHVNEEPSDYGFFYVEEKSIENKSHFNSVNTDFKIPNN